MIHISNNSLRWEAMLTEPLEQRIGIAPDELVSCITQDHSRANNALPFDSGLEFAGDIRDAIAELPVSLREKLEFKLLGIFFMSGLDSSATTGVIAYPNGDLIGAFVVIDTHVFLSQTANEWATWNENHSFLDKGTGTVQLDVKIVEDAADNRTAAMQFILLHEFGRVMAAESDLLPNWWEEAPFRKGSYPFLDLGWAFDQQGKIQPVHQQDFLLRQGAKFHEQGKLPASDIRLIYQGLAATFFPTLRASASVHEDFVESFATYVHVVLLKKKWEVTLRDGDTIIEQYSDFWASPRSNAKRAFFDMFFCEEPQLSKQRKEHAAMARTCLELLQQSGKRFLALAPFLRLNIANVDLRQIADILLSETNLHQGNAFLWMNLSTLFFTMAQKELALAMQAEALAMQRLYHSPATQQPAKARLLMIVSSGDLAQNTPLDCLLEDSCIDLVFYFATPDEPLPKDMPEHDVLMVAISQTDDSHAILAALEEALNRYEKPVINRPQYIPGVERNTASRLLQGVHGLSMPLTHHVTRSTLEAVTRGETAIGDIFSDCRFPVILRPTWSYAGHGLEKIEDADALSRYFLTVPEEHFYISNFIDYSSADGQFRKYRIALVKKTPFIAHMAISSHWMVHYVNAGMYEDREKRMEEAQFMENFAAFVERHRTALLGIHERSQLEYVCIDCAETRDGELLIFEIDHASVVHAMDPVELFPHKQKHVLKIKQAVEDLILDQNPN
ncbi:hypothetical protein [Castellaniella sp. MT123]|uniref:ATP-grasp domain-containing protein n=1 Tax=Castellaniella sp. MT123 TaxID=3140381 RepID=UPI0031F37FCF